jgi:hypothetical protein
MSENTLIEALAALVDRNSLPARVPVIGLEPTTVDDIQRRLRDLLGTLGLVTGVLPDLGLSNEGDRTVLRLPLGGQLAGYHASGALEFKSTMGPMDNLIGAPPSVEELIQLVQSAAGRLQLGGLVGEGESLGFERLWQIKATGMNRDGVAANTIVCRAVGAFRHHVADVPVWGPASVAVQVAGGGVLDALRINVRTSTDRIVDAVPPLSPDVAKSFRFGYFNLPKRKSQAVLPPVYVAEVETGGEEPMSYLAVVSGTEREFMPLARAGAAPSITQRRADSPLPV